MHIRLSRQISQVAITLPIQSQLRTEVHLTFPFRDGNVSYVSWINGPTITISIVPCQSWHDGVPVPTPNEPGELAVER